MQRRKGTKRDAAPHFLADSQRKGSKVKDTGESPSPVAQPKKIFKHFTFNAFLRFLLEVSLVPSTCAAAVRLQRRNSPLFALLFYGTLVSSTATVTFSISTDNSFWAAFAQTTLYIFQAYGAFDGRLRCAKQQADEENSTASRRSKPSDKYCFCIVAAALSAVISTSTNARSSPTSTMFAFVANLFQVAGTISVANNVG